MSIFSSFGVNASGMTAQRYRMDIISQNVANANTTRTEDGTPYRRKVVRFTEKTTNPTEFGTIFRKSRGMDVGDGVKVSGVYEDHKEDMKLVYDPSHPDAGRSPAGAGSADQHDRQHESIRGQRDRVYREQSDGCERPGYRKDMMNRDPKMLTVLMKRG